MRLRLLGPALLLWLGAACADLDTMIHNGVHCSAVNEQTCTGKEDRWDRLCLSCEEPYDWAVDYEWTESTLEPGQRVRPIPPEQVQSLRLLTADGQGELDAYYVPSHGEDPELAGVTVIYSHGNYASIEHYMPRLRFLYEAGFALLAWDYRGYGKSDPVDYPSAEQFLADARLVREVLADPLGVQGPVVVYANSLGTIPALEMAMHDPPCAVMLEVPFTGIGPVGEGATGLDMPGSFLTSGAYETTLRVAELRSPLLVMGGEADRTIPAESVRELYAAAPEPKRLWMLEGVGHGVGQGGGVPEAGLGVYVEAMRDFLAEEAGGCAP